MVKAEANLARVERELSSRLHEAELREANARSLLSSLQDAKDHDASTYTPECKMKQSPVSTNIASESFVVNEPNGDTCRKEQQSPEISSERATSCKQGQPRPLPPLISELKVGSAEDAMARMHITQRQAVETF